MNMPGIALHRPEIILRNRSFAECYCRRHGVCREGFLLSILQRTLHPHVRPWFSLLLEFRPHYFAADYDFIVTVGRVRHYAEFETAVGEFSAHPGNRGFLRRWLRLRVSTRRMRRVLREIYVRTQFVLPDDFGGGTLSPFAGGSRPVAPPADAVGSCN